MLATGVTDVKADYIQGVDLVVAGAHVQQCRPSSAALGADGTLYFGSWDQKVYTPSAEAVALPRAPGLCAAKNLHHTGRAPSR